MNHTGDVHTEPSSGPDRGQEKAPVSAQENEYPTDRIGRFETDPRYKRSTRQVQNIGLAATAGTLMVSSILVGYVGGVWLDAKLKTDPVFMVIGVLLGMVAGIVELIQMVRRISGGTRGSG